MLCHSNEQDNGSFGSAFRMTKSVFGKTNFGTLENLTPRIEELSNKPLVESTRDGRERLDAVRENKQADQPITRVVDIFVFVLHVCSEFFRKIAVN